MGTSTSKLITQHSTILSKPIVREVVTSYAAGVIAGYLGHKTGVYMAEHGKEQNKHTNNSSYRMNPR